MALAEALLIETADALQLAAAQMQTATVLALDTEFVRTDTFYPQLGLVQLAIEGHSWLVDPLAMSQRDLDPLVAVLENPRISKVIHSCSEDLEVLRYALCCVPTPIFDTQIAAAFVGMGFSRSYSALVQTLTGVELDKHQTRSDWLRRPLSTAQKRYAAEDVVYLLAVHQALQNQLQSQHRAAWFEEDMRGLLNTARTETADDCYYRKVKGAWKLSQRSLGMLQLTCAWREREARLKNRPRGRIINDKALLQIALAGPEQPQQLAEQCALPPRVVRSYGEQLLALVSEARGVPVEALPAPLPKPVPRQYGGVLKSCREFVQQRATAMDIAPEMLARKADLEYLVRSLARADGRLSASLSLGWRKSVIGDELLAFAKERVVEQV